MLLRKIKNIEENPLQLIEQDVPVSKENEILIKVKTCGICHTDLHIIEGELPSHKIPIVPGHQIIGVVESKGSEVKKLKVGDRVGVTWLNSTCGKCAFCLGNQENLCEDARFTGYDVDGGYVEYTVAPESFAYPIPDVFSDTKAAPLLCAGIIGFRALRLSGAKKGGILGLYGFGASAHITIQVATFLGCEVYVFSRSKEHRNLAEELGAKWTGKSTDLPPRKLDCAIIFAPAGNLIIDALKVLNKGGKLVLAGIYMTPIPSMDYALIYYEKSIKSVANSTRDDAIKFLGIAERIPVKPMVEVFKLEEANSALNLLKKGKIKGCGVLKIS